MGEEDSFSFLSSCVLDISSFALRPCPKKKWRLLYSLWLGTIREPTLQRLCVCREWTCRRQTRSGGDKSSFVLHWFFCKEFEDAQEQAPTQVPNHDKFVDTQTALWPSLTIRRTNVHLDSCSLTIAHALLPGDHCSLFSLGACQSDGMLQKRILAETVVGGLICVAPNLLSVKSERSNYT